MALVGESKREVWNTMIGQDEWIFFVRSVSSVLQSYINTVLFNSGKYVKKKLWKVVKSEPNSFQISQEFTKKVRWNSVEYFPIRIWFLVGLSENSDKSFLLVGFWMKNLSFMKSSSTQSKRKTWIRKISVKPREIPVSSSTAYSYCYCTNTAQPNETKTTRPTLLSLACCTKPSSYHSQFHSKHPSFIITQSSLFSHWYWRQL